MTTPAGFTEAELADLDEPVRRYFRHAIAAGAPLSRGVRLRLSGRIKVGVWLSFDSTWEGDGRSFSWDATAGPGRRPLRVHDAFAEGRGVMDVRLRRPPLRLVHAEDEHTARSGAGRAALEAIWTPASLLPSRGVRWRAESPTAIVASLDVPPEQPEVHLTLSSEGAVRSVRGRRWRDAKRGYEPFGADVEAEATFHGLTIPGRLTAGWGHGTDAWSPFFECEVTALELVG
jgi:hypothetical protein